MGERIPLSLEAARQGWLEDCALAGMSPQTIQGYGKQSKKLSGALLRGGLEPPSSRSLPVAVRPEQRIDGGCSTPELPEAGAPDVTAFTAALAREIISARIRSGVALSSIRVMHAIWSSFGRWCVENHHLSENPMARIPRPKDQQKPHRYLSRDELAKVWQAACESRYPSETKLILLLLMEGLRAGELCSLRWQDVREDRIVLTGKGGKVRAIPLRASARTLLVLRAKSGPRIFKTSVGSLEQRIKRLGRASGVPHLHPHLLRHTFASQALMAGMDEGTLRTLGGWSPRSAAFERYVKSAREDAAILRAADFDLTDRLFDS